MLILNSFIYKKVMRISSRHYCCLNVWNNEDSNAFSVKLLDILFFYMCTFWKNIKKWSLVFPFG